MKYLLAFVTLTCCMGAFSQTHGDFEVLFENQSVLISANRVECELTGTDLHHINRLISIENKTNQAIVVEWQSEMYYDGSCKTCEQDEYRLSFQVPAKSTVSGKCDDVTNRLKILERDLNGWVKSELTDLRISNVQVKIEER